MRRHGAAGKGAWAVLIVMVSPSVPAAYGDGFRPCNAWSGQAQEAMPEEPARRGLDKPALKKPRRSTQGLGLRNKRWAGEEAKAALGPVSRQKGQGQNGIGAPGGEAKGPGAEGKRASEHGL